MSDLNPYASYLDGRPVEAILASTIADLDALLKSIGPAKTATRPAPEKWSPAEILCHLADCEIVFSFRLRQTLAEDGPTIQPFDQEKWAVTYPGIPAAQAFELFSALRRWNLLLLKSALPGAAGRTTTHPGRGAITFQILLETIAGHDLNHLAQVRKLATA
jgi:hypothetical protein